LDPVSGDEYNVLGLCWVADGKTPKAETAFRTALALNPYQPNYLVNLATLCWKSGRPEEAADWYRKGMALCPKEALYPLNLGRLYLREGKPLQAIPELQTAWGLAPQNPDVLHGLGEAYEKIGQTDLAKQWFDKARTVSAKFR
jgi:tetratricopeptide (TPR) repeat protein